METTAKHSTKRLLCVRKHGACIYIKIEFNYEMATKTCSKVAPCTVIMSCKYPSIDKKKVDQLTIRSRKFAGRWTKFARLFTFYSVPCLLVSKAGRRTTQDILHHCTGLANSLHFSIQLFEHLFNGVITLMVMKLSVSVPIRTYCTRSIIRLVFAE